MEWYNNILCATFEDLTSGKSAVVAKGGLTSLIRRNPSLRVRRGGAYQTALINYYALPPRYRQMYEREYGDPKEMLQKEAMRKTLALDKDARAFYEAYRYEKRGEIVSLTDKLIKEYTINASVLNELQKELDERRTYRRARGGSVVRLWETLEGSCEALRDAYGHTLPANMTRLKEKMARYKKEGYASLISGKVGNMSATVIDGDAGRLIIALKQSRTPVYTDAQILREYNRRAAENGWKMLKSQKALTMFLNRPEIVQLWYGAVHGELKAHQTFGRKHSTALPTRRDALWYGDGTKLNLYYKAIENGRTVVRTMQVYEVIDAYSEALLGYHISPTEDYEAQYLAYRMAVRVAGRKPYELVSDNQGGHKKLDNQKLFKHISRVYRPTAPHKGQAKTIESVFGRFQKEVLHKSWFFTGCNITAKGKESRPNTEFINANVDKLPTLEEVKRIYAEYRKEWNDMAHPATGVGRMEMYRSSENPEAPELTVEEMAEMFWITTDRQSTYTANGIRITVKGKEYDYEVYGGDGMPDHKFYRKNIGRKFQVMYDPYDTKSIRLYTVDADGSKRFVCVAETKYVIHRAIQDQTAEDRAFIRAQTEADREDRMERQAEARVIELEHGVAPEQNGLKRPKLAGMTGGQEATEREIRRRMKKYAQDPEVITPGGLGKRISQMMINPQTGGIEFDECRAVAKL